MPFKFSEAFPSRWLLPADLPAGRRILVYIDCFTQEPMYDSQARKEVHGWCVTFIDEDNNILRPLPLNKSNSNTLRDLFGDDADNAQGEAVYIERGVLGFGKESVVIVPERVNRRAPKRWGPEGANALLIKLRAWEVSLDDFVRQIREIDLDVHARVSGLQVEDWPRDSAVNAACRQIMASIAAWGNHGNHRNRCYVFRRLVGARRIDCLGRTKADQPRHPLYLPADVQPIPWLNGSRVNGGDPRLTDPTLQAPHRPIPREIHTERPKQPPPAQLPLDPGDYSVLTTKEQHPS